MQMRKEIIVSILVTIAVAAALALVTIGLGRAEVMMRNAEEYSEKHMNFDGSMVAHMNATDHMYGNMPRECQDLHDQVNVTNHMMGIP